MTGTLAIAERLVALELAQRADTLRFYPLTGGVSSDIWRVEGADTPLCVKRARPALAVAADWRVPVQRSHHEAEFLRVVVKDVPGFAPPLLAEDLDEGFIVLPYLDPSAWRLWKADLLAGDVNPEIARRTGALLGRLGCATRNRPDLARRFDTGSYFDALRLDPYLRECARVHPDLAAPLDALIDETCGRREALVHGDASPKNILVGRGGVPLILDAECAFYADPAFDLAFLLNHFLLKSVHRPDRLLAFRTAMASVLAGHAETENPDYMAAVQARASRLLPGLMLARVDGKSPVEYLTDPAKRAQVRTIARAFLLTPTENPIEIADRLADEVAA